MPDFSLFLNFHLSIIQIPESRLQIMKTNEHFNTKRQNFLKNGPKSGGAGINLLKAIGVHKTGMNTNGSIMYDFPHISSVA